MAEQSSESARKIEDIIDILLSNSRDAVTTMKQVKQIIGEQTEYICHTDEAFIEIQKGVEETIKGMYVISNKAQEMDKARVNVVDVVNSLTAIAEENACSTENTATSVTEIRNIIDDIAEKANSLNVIAEELENRIKVFQL